jgi:clan AA aspartic protease (TIGR02281 family)
LVAKVSVAGFASLLLAGAPAPVQANDFGGLIGGVVGGMIGSMQRPQYYQAPQPQYYQPAPQYYQAQPQYHQYQGQSQSSTAARRAAEAKRAKEAKEKKEKEEAAAAAAAATPAVATTEANGVLDVPMTRKNGNLWVPAQINKVVTIDFVIDSGASDITLPRDVYMTLIRSGTLTKANYIGNVNFGIADGSEVKGVKFKLASLQVGNQTLTNVTASVMPSDSATPLLGLSFLSRFQSWAIDNNSGTLKLTPIGAALAAPAATQTAAAAPAPAAKQALPDLPASPNAPAETAAPQVTAAVPAQTTAPNAVPASAQSAAMPTTQAKAALVSQPQPETTVPTPTVVTAVPQMPPSSVPMPASEPTKIASAAPDAPRSGRVASSMFLATGSATPAPAAAVSAPPAAATAAAPTPAPAPTQMASASAQVPAFPANTPYANARIGLMALGYSPAAMADAGKCDANTDLTCFPERLACAKTDNIHCDFMWRRGEQVIKVKTTAIPPTISTVECQVNCNK